MLRLLIALSIALAFSACGRESARTLRQGQLPVYDFPLYLTEGVPGRVWKIDSDRTKTLLVEGLNDPRGIATDRFQNLYVAEYGAGRVLRFPGGEAPYEVLAENLASPSVVAVDSFGEVYVAQDGAMNIMRVGDGKIFGSYQSVPTALAFGVDDIPVIGLFNENKVFWSWTQGADDLIVSNPNNASIDGTGRVYIAQADPENGQVIRYHQREPGAGTVVADSLLGPTGIAADLIGNLFVVEQGANRIILITYEGRKFDWLSGIEDGQYLAFTQY